MIWRFCFKLYILVCNFSATIGAFNVRFLFHCDKINNEWNKLHMFVHHSWRNWTSLARKCFIKPMRYLYMGSTIIVMLNPKREGNLLIISGSSYLVKPKSKKWLTVGFKFFSTFNVNNGGCRVTNFLISLAKFECFQKTSHLVEVYPRHYQLRSWLCFQNLEKCMPFHFKTAQKLNCRYHIFCTLRP
jgi:hypothetical protein